MVSGGVPPQCAPDDDESAGDELETPADHERLERLQVHGATAPESMKNWYGSRVIVRWLHNVPGSPDAKNSSGGSIIRQISQAWKAKLIASR